MIKLITIKNKIYLFKKNQNKLLPNTKLTNNWMKKMKFL